MHIHDYVWILYFKSTMWYMTIKSGDSPRRLDDDVATVEFSYWRRRGFPKRRMADRGKMHCFSLCAYHHRYLMWLFHNQVLIFTHSVFLVKNSLLYGMPSLLYQTDGQGRNDDGKWQRYVIPLPEGDFRLQFVFTMGYPFESAAGLDSVTLIACGTGNDMLPLQGDEYLEVESVRSFSVNLPKLFTLCPSNLCSFSCALFSVILSANQHSFTHFA